MHAMGRWTLFLLLLLGGIGLSLFVTLALGQRAGWGFLFLPFLFPPLVWRRGEAAAGAPRLECPQCGWSSFEPADRFCPRDGASLGPPLGPGAAGPRVP